MEMDFLKGISPLCAVPTIYLKYICEPAGVLFLLVGTGCSLHHFKICFSTWAAQFRKAMGYELSLLSCKLLELGMGYSRATSGPCDLSPREL